METKQNISQFSITFPIRDLNTPYRVTSLLLSQSVFPDIWADLLLLPRVLSSTRARRGWRDKNVEHDPSSYIDFVSVRPVLLILKYFSNVEKKKKNRSATITVTNVSFFRGLRRTLRCKVSARQAQPRKVSATVCICTRVFLEFEYRYGHRFSPTWIYLVNYLSQVCSRSLSRIQTRTRSAIHSSRIPKESAWRDWNP